MEGDAPCSSEAAERELTLRWARVETPGVWPFVQQLSATLVVQQSRSMVFKAYIESASRRYKEMINKIKL